MRTRSIPFLTIVILLVACASQEVTDLPTSPTSTRLPLPTATTKPVQTSESTPVPISVDEILLDSCNRIVGAKKSDAGVLEVIYSRGGDFSVELPEDTSGLVTGDYPIGFWSWREDTREANPFLQPPDALDSRLSPDQQWIVFQRNVEDNSRSEIWVVDTSGQHEKRLATITFDEIKTRNPGLNIDFAFLGYGWVPQRDQIYYYVELDGPDMGHHPSTYDVFNLVDIQSGESIPLIPPGRASSVIFAPDGSQAAVLFASEPSGADTATIGSQPAAFYNPGELRLINTHDGSLQLKLPIPLRNSLGLVGLDSLAYSPDGSHLIGFSYDGIISINIKEGRWQMIPLNYTVLIGNRDYEYSFGFRWGGNSTILVSLTNMPEGAPAINYPDDSRRKPEASFTIWQVDLAAESAQAIRTFRGFTNPYGISSDGRYAAFRVFETKGNASNAKYAAFRGPGAALAGGGGPNIILADVNTGKEVLTLDAIDFFEWSPYSDRYVYGQYYGEYENGALPLHLALGHIGEEPISLGTVRGFPPYFEASWVDENTLLLGCKIVRFK